MNEWKDWKEKKKGLNRIMQWRLCSIRFDSKEDLNPKDGMDE
jgi:hypothetical protein